MVQEKSKILVVEDDPDIQQLLQHQFQQAGYRVEQAVNGQEGLKKAKERKPDLIILDLMLPGVDGLEVCRGLRSGTDTKNIPVLMLTAKGEEVDKIVGFELGADDYMTKPFSPRELLLRVKALLRRSSAPTPTGEEKEISFGKLKLDLARHRVFIGTEEIELTAIEFKLIQYFISTKGRVQSRDTLLDKVWGYDAFVTTRTVDTHVKRLREKLGSLGDYIETVRGIGYRFRESPTK